MNLPDKGQARHRNILRDERGILLVSLAMVFAMAAVFIAAAATRTTKDRVSTTIRTENLAAAYAAQAGEQAMKAAIRQDALARFEVARAAWNGSGAILSQANQAIFFSPNVNLPDVLLPNGAAVTNVRAQLLPNFQQITLQSQVYSFSYNIFADGRDPNSPNRVTTLNTNGSFEIRFNRQSFANYMLFTGIHSMVSGTKVWFTSNTNFRGRVHTNTRFAFAYFPTFSNGLVSSVQNDAYFYNNGSNLLLDADSNPPRDVPIFGEGFDRGADSIPMPTNAFDQRSAAVGGTVTNNSELRLELGLPIGITPPPDGVYVPTNGAALKGGIYVQGNVSNVLLSVDGSHRQNYQITHSNGSTSNIVVDRANNTTTVNSVTYQGIPNGALYVAGNVSSLGGPTRSGGVTSPAVQADTALTVISEGGVTITRDLVYEEDPLTVSDAANILGIFTPGGDIRIGTSAPNDIVINSTLMTSDDTGVIQVDNYDSGSPRGTATILGGAIMRYYGAFGTFDSNGHRSGYARNFVYDQRLNGGLAPPYFPSTTLFDPPTFNNTNQTVWDSRRDNDPANSQGFVVPSSIPDFNPNFSGV
ncbi:DUF4900 domain-containing protein [Candidatus Poribacteria bacterium]|nr:DUF4900 domain-containing protein [Candidatus Poribacteria bacterium]